MSQYRYWPGLLTGLSLLLLSTAVAQSVKTSGSDHGAERASALSHLDQGDAYYRKQQWQAMKTEDSTGLQIGLRLKDSFVIALAYYGLGKLSQETNKKEDAEKYFQQALTLRFEKEQSSYTAAVYNDIGYLYGLKGELDRQREWYLRSMRLYDKVNDSSGMAETLSNLSGSSLELGNKQEAIMYARQALAIREQGQDMDVLALSCNNLSQIYLQTDSMDQAIHYQKEGMRYAEVSGSKRLLAQSYTSMSLLLNRQGKNKEALEYEKKAIALCRVTGDSAMLARRCIAAGIISGTLKDAAGAVKYFDEAEIVAKAIGDKYNLRDLYLYRTIFYKERKDFYNAYENIKKYNVYKDSILNEETTRNIAEMQTKYETEKKDKAIGELQASGKIHELEIGKQKATITIIIGSVILLALMAVGVFNRYQLKKKLQQQQALLEMRNDIARDLHDELGSTLTSIHILSQVSRNHLHLDKEGRAYSLLEKITEQSRQMQQSMSDIVWAIRSDNDKIENMMVRMREYLAETLEAKNIAIRFEAAEELLGYSFSMQQRKDIFLIFKEAVNNAAKYAACTLLEVSFRLCDGRILLEVKDNGVGFEPDKLRSGNGLNNMRTRSASLSGECRIDAAPGKGTTVLLDLPTAT